MKTNKTNTHIKKIKNNIHAHKQKKIKKQRHGKKHTNNINKK